MVTFLGLFRKGGGGGGKAEQFTDSFDFILQSLLVEQNRYVAYEHFCSFQNA